MQSPALGACLHTLPPRNSHPLSHPAGNRNRKLAAVAPRPGLALLHKHGEHCLDHEAAEVRSGVKYVLRSDVVFERRR